MRSATRLGLILSGAGPSSGNLIASSLAVSGKTSHPPNILEAGGTEVSTAAGGARRYRKPLKCFRWRDIQCIFLDSLDGWSKHKAPRLGAALSFYTLLSMAPLLLVLVSIVSIVRGAKAAQQDVIGQIQAVAGGAGAQAARSLLGVSHSTEHGILATLLGVITLLFGASGVLLELREALNTIWDVPSPELSGLRMIGQFIKDRLFSFALVLAVGFLLVVSLFISAWISALGKFSSTYLPAPEVILHVLNFLVSFFVISLLFSAIYKFVPDAPIEWRDVALGGAVTSALFTAGKFALGIYLGRAAFISMYGAAASIVVLIVWVYYSAQIFFLGAEFTKVFADRHGSQPSNHPRGMVVPSDKSPTPATVPRIVTPSEAAAQDAETPGSISK